MILFILGIIFLICSFILIYQSNQIKIKRNKEQEKYEEALKKEIFYLEKEKNLINNEYIQKRNNINDELKQWQKEREDEIKAYLESEEKLAKQNINIAYDSAQQKIFEINNHIETTRNSAQEEEIKIKKEIEKIRASLSAGVEARLREQEKNEKINFYKLSINETDLSDIKKLNNLKNSFHKPVVLSKLIWTQYFQKQITELCDRVLGKETICGIYKITNLLTEQCYIGQSVNIADRFKQHCKCGLGIDASSTNALYNNMQKDGVWNFSFELLEKCPREQLNEKEAFWINMYSSNIYGLNTTKGNKA